MKLSLIPLSHDYQPTCRSLSYRELDGLESKEDKIYPVLGVFLMRGGGGGGRRGGLRKEYNRSSPCDHSSKRQALVTTTFSNSRGCRLRELRLYVDFRVILANGYHPSWEDQSRSVSMVDCFISKAF